MGSLGKQGVIPGKNPNKTETGFPILPISNLILRITNTISMQKTQSQNLKWFGSYRRTYAISLEELRSLKNGAVSIYTIYHFLRLFANPNTFFFYYSTERRRKNNLGKTSSPTILTPKLYFICIHCQ